MRLKTKKYNNDTDTRSRQRSTLKSNPREPEGTILGDMMRIMELLEDNRRIKRER